MKSSYYRKNPYESWEGMSCRECKNRKRKHCKVTGLKVPNNWRHFHCLSYK